MKKRSLFIIALSLALFCCGRYSQNAIPVGAPNTQAPRVEGEYKICPGDRLSLRLFYNPDLNQEVTVRPDGRIQLMLVDEVAVAGLTPAKLKGILVENYAKHIQKPEIAVIVNAFAGHRIFIGGEVAAPGPRDLQSPTRILQAILMAGGFRDTSRTEEVIVIRMDEEGKPFMIAVDVGKAMKGIDLSQDIYLRPFDVVLVPRTTIGDINAWVGQYLTGEASRIPRDFMLYYGFYDTTILHRGTSATVISPSAR